MTQREKTMATLLGGFVLFGGGFFGIFAYMKANAAANTAIVELQKQVDEGKAKIQAVHREAPVLLSYRRRSMPANLDVARADYKIYIKELLRKHGLTSGLEFNLPPPDTKSLVMHPGKPGKQSVYTGINFLVRFKAKMKNLVEFMYDFQNDKKQPHMQRIKSYTIEQRSDDKKEAEWLQVQMTFEALSILDAEQFQKKSGGPDPAVVAYVTWPLGTSSFRTGPLNPPLSRTYEQIARRNIFRGYVDPERVIPTAFTPPADDLVNVMRFNRLISLTEHEGAVEAWMWDAYNNKSWRLSPRGGFNRWKMVQTDKGAAVVSGQIVKIEDNDVIFRVILQHSNDYKSSSRWRYPDDKNFYRLHPQDFEALVKQGSVEEADKTNLFVVSQKYWEILTKENKGKLEVSSDGKRFRVLGDASQGDVISNEKDVVIFRLSSTWPSNLLDPLPSSIASTRVYPEESTIYAIEPKHFKDLLTDKTVAAKSYGGALKPEDIDRVFVMRATEWEHLRTQKILRPDPSGTFTFYENMIGGDVISRPNDLVVFRLWEKYCLCPADRSAGTKDNWHEGYCVLRLGYYAQDALQEVATFSTFLRGSLRLGSNAQEVFQEPLIQESSKDGRQGRRGKD